MTRFKSNDVFVKTFNIIYCHLEGISCPVQCSVLHPFSFLRYLIRIYSFPYLPPCLSLMSNVWHHNYTEHLIKRIFINLYALHWNLPKTNFVFKLCYDWWKKHLGFTFYWPTMYTQSQGYNVHQSHCVTPVCFYYRCFFILNKKASIRWQDSARRQFEAGLKGDVGL